MFMQKLITNLNSEHICTALFSLKKSKSSKISHFFITFKYLVEYNY